MLSDFPGEHMSNEALLALDVDVLIPAAIENVLNADTAPKVAARLVVEAANGPTTHEADAVLNERGISVVPDILANSGGVIASYVEWRQAKSGSLTEAKETYGTVEDRLGLAFRRTTDAQDRHEVSMRLASQIVAVDEIILSMQDRAWI